MLRVLTPTSHQFLAGSAAVAARRACLQRLGHSRQSCPELLLSTGQVRHGQLDGPQHSQCSGYSAPIRKLADVSLRNTPLGQLAVPALPRLGQLLPLPPLELLQRAHCGAHCCVRGRQPPAGRLHPTEVQQDSATQVRTQLVPLSILAMQRTFRGPDEALPDVPLRLGKATQIAVQLGRHRQGVELVAAPPSHHMRQRRGQGHLQRGIEPGAPVASVDAGHNAVSVAAVEGGRLCQVQAQHHLLQRVPRLGSLVRALLLAPGFLGGVFIGTREDVDIGLQAREQGAP
mmetsp:Transcript_4602/g.11489  ORF Transcript_4602/g.11489 Transcript_4602/m.11489 type:complete len:287 (+) Transcript_4602:495-1355(+)